MGTLVRGAFALLLPAVAWAAELSVTAPAIGAIRDCEGRVRQVFGAPGAFVLGQPQADRKFATQPVYQDAKIEGRSLMLRRADGSEKRVPLPEAASRPQRMNSQWLVAIPFAIKLTAEGATVYRLPMKACGEAAR